MPSSVRGSTKVTADIVIIAWQAAGYCAAQCTAMLPPTL
jgi:hypothetical protein